MNAEEYHIQKSFQEEYDEFIYKYGFRSILAKAVFFLHSIPRAKARSKMILHRFIRLFRN